jgi:hypothetical protein
LALWQENQKLNENNGFYTRSQNKAVKSYWVIVTSADIYDTVASQLDQVCQLEIL